MATIDGYLVEQLLWEEGFDYILEDDEESAKTVLKLVGTDTDVGLVWPDEDSSSGWSFEVGDIYLYHHGELHTSIMAEDPYDLVTEVMGAIQELGVDTR